jgi:hypothetical protein
MSRRKQGEQFRPSDRIAAWARATEDYAESLEDQDLANVYFGKSLGLWQAFQILTAEERRTRGGSGRAASPPCGSRRADRAARPAAARPVGATASSAAGGGRP